MKKWQLRVRKIHFSGEAVSSMIFEFQYVPKNIYIFNMFFLLISGVGKSMFQNCCNLFKVYPHIAWTMCVSTNHNNLILSSLTNL